MLKLMHWNANSLLSSNRINQLYSLLSSHNAPDVIGITESKTTESFQFHVNHYSLLSFPCKRNSSGIIICISNKLNHSHCPEFSLSPSQQSSLSDGSNSMIEWIKILYNSTEMYVGFLYRHPRCTADDWKVLLSSIDKVVNCGKPFVLLGDFNARSPQWRDVCESNSGDVKQFLNDNPEVCVLNSIYAAGHITRHSGDAGSIIDLGMTNALNIISNFVVDDNVPLLSDHIPIVVVVGDLYNAARHARRYYATKNVDAFLEYIDLFFDKYSFEIDLCRMEQDSKNPEETVNALCKEISAKFLQAVSLAFDIYKPHKDKLIKFSSKSVALHNALRDFHHFHNVFSKHRTNENKTLLANAQLHYKEVIASEKAAYMQKLVNGMEDKNERWKTWHRLSPKPRIFPFIEEHDVLLDENKSLEALSHYFESTFRLHTVDAKDVSHTTQQAALHTHDEIKAFMNDLHECEDMNPCSFDADELRSICEQHKFSGVGFDDIPGMLVKQAIASSDNFVFALLALYKYAYTHAIYPDAWKISKCIPLFKRKGDKKSVNNYRPISITPVLSRIFERLILKTLSLLITPHLSPFQAGFREKHSTLDLIYCLRESTHFAHINNSFLPVVFLDIEKAFDSVWHDALLYKLSLMRIPYGLIKLIHSFLSNRSFAVCYDDRMSSMCAIEAGVPQGCVLSPILFNAYVNDVHPNPHSCMLHINHAQALVYLFADDMCVVPTMIGDAGVRYVQSTLNALYDWSHVWKMRFSLSKSQCVVFSTLHKLPRIVFRLGDHNLANVDSYKYLGVLFHARGSFQLHEDNLTIKLNHVKSLIMRLFSKNIIISPLIIRFLIKCVLLPSVTYAIALWTPSVAFCSYVTSVMSLLLRMSVHAPNVTSKHGLLLEFRLLPLSYVKTYFAGLFVCKLKQNEGCILSKKYFHKEVLSMAVDESKLFKVAHPIRESRRNSTHIPKRSTLYRKIQKLNEYKDDSLLDDINIDEFIDDSDKFKKEIFELKLLADFVQNEMSKPHTDIKTWLECTELDSVNLEMPYLSTHYDKAFTFNFIRLRLDMLKCNASLIGRHRSHATPSDLFCTFCNEDRPDTREHILLECCHFAAKRHQLESILLMYDNTIQLSLKFLLNNICNMPSRRANVLYNAIFDFLSFIFKSRFPL